MPPACRPMSSVSNSRYSPGRLSLHLNKTLCGWLTPPSRSKRVGILGKFYIRRKVGNSFLGQGAVFRHCPLCGSLYLRLWLTRRPCVRLFLRATRARSVLVLCRSGVRSGLYLRACRAQSADDYAHTRTVPASPDPLAHGRSPVAVAERS